MGFETERFCSLLSCPTHNKAVPMGFETLKALKHLKNLLTNNKAVPMGFETKL